VLKQIQKTEKIPHPSSVFSPIISEEHNNKINEQFDLHEKNILRALERGNSHFVDYLLGELKKFCEIMNFKKEYESKRNEIIQKLSQRMNEKYEQVVKDFQK
jgi:hypothetical protein